MCDKKTLDANHFSPDVADFVLLLHKHRVRYLLVGGVAVIFYGHARLTGDVDFFYDNSEANAMALYNALLDFWNDNIPEITNFCELQQPGLILQFGLPPNRIDLLNEISGIDFDGAWERRVEVDLPSESGNTPLYIIDKSDLLTNKQCANRPKDQDDVRFFSDIQDQT